jgi:hypothetical protein
MNGNSGRFSLDTNLLVYSVDRAAVRDIGRRSKLSIEQPNATAIWLSKLCPSSMLPSRAKG